MRIISGNFRGKKIKEPKDIKTRPLKDLVKESIFNILIHSKKIILDMPKVNVLDLFSGVGSFGIECLSREVRSVVFIENYKGVLPVLKINLQNLKDVKNYKIVEKDIYGDILLNLNRKFDLIFLDPPYKDKDLNKIFAKIRDGKIMSKNGIIILHRHKNEKSVMPADYKIIDEKIYGLSKIIFMSVLK